jgi:SNF2 family DNA or RNA helicase
MCADSFGMESLLASLGVDIQDEKKVHTEIIRDKILQDIHFPSNPLVKPLMTTSASSCLPILSTHSSLTLMNEITTELNQQQLSSNEYHRSYFKYLFFQRVCANNNTNIEQQPNEDIFTPSLFPPERILPIHSSEPPVLMNPTSATCPLCEETLQIPKNQSIDVIVSSHIDSTCKQNHNKRKRSSQIIATPIPIAVTRTPTVTTVHTRDRTSRVTRSSSSRQSPVRHLSRVTEQRISDLDDEYEDEEEEEDDDDEVTVSRARLRNTTMKLNPIEMSPVVDDWEDDVFERRLWEYEVRLQPIDEEEVKESEEGEGAAEPPLSHNDQVRLRELKRRLNLGEKISSHNSIVEESTWTSLYEYQREGVAWMWGLYLSGGGTGGILGDEMGLGKTAQLCTHYSSIANEEFYRLQSPMNPNPPRPLLLVVCPATVQHHWLQEFHRWAPRLRVVILHSISPTYAALNTMGQAAIKRAIHKITQPTDSSVPSSCGVVLLVSYEGLRTLQKILLNIRWVAVSLDEGQKIKNPDTAITLLCKDLPTFHRLILSGTPIQNSLKELWSLFDFVFPGRLGTLSSFETEFATPIKIGGYNTATRLQVEIAIKSATILQAMIRPYLLRRKKDQIMNLIQLPKKIEQVLFCVLSPTQRLIYQEIINSPELTSALRLKKPLFGIIMTLRKLCNHPVLAYQVGQIKWHSESTCETTVDDDLLGGGGTSIDKNQIHWSDSGKLLVLSRILPLWKSEQHKVLIFCQMYSMIALVELLLNELSLKFMRLDGRTPVSRRQNIINHFNSPESDVMILLLTTRTGGVGISLTAANRVVLVDPDWNPQVDIQARERAWRIGQRREVIIYRLITRGTIEEKIYHRQIFKLLLTNRILENPKQKRFFSKHEIQELFELENSHTSLPPDGDFEISLDEEEERRGDEVEEGEIEEGEISEGRRGRTGEEEQLLNSETLKTIESTIATFQQMEQRLLTQNSTTTSPSTAPAPQSPSPGDDTNIDSPPNRDQQLLRALYNGEAISAVYDHTYFEGNNTNKDRREQRYKKQDEQIKELAKQVVDEAVKQLRNSNSVYTNGGERGTSSRDRLGFVPTAPVSSSNSRGRFSTTSVRPSSSSSMLSGLRQLQGRPPSSSSSEQISDPVVAGASIPPSPMTSSVLIRLQNIFQQRSVTQNGGLTTQEVLCHFNDLPDQFAPIFREMLRRVATLSDGKWKPLVPT